MCRIQGHARTAPDLGCIQGPASQHVCNSHASGRAEGGSSEGPVRYVEEHRDRHAFSDVITVGILGASAGVLVPEDVLSWVFLMPDFECSWAM